MASDVNATIGAVALTGTGVTLGTASITIINGGSGYTGAPIVQFNPTNGGSGAAGTANIVNGQIVSINVTNAGTGYLTAPTVTILTGTGAAANTTLNTSGALDFSTLSATNVGFGLNVPNAGTVNSINFLEYLKTQGNGGISIIAGSGTGNTNALSSINVTNPGNGYTVVPTVTIDTTNNIGLPPTTQPYLGITNGSITLAPLNSASAGYTIGDVLELQDFQGSPRAPFNLLYPGTTGSNRFVVVTNVSPLTGGITGFEQSYNANSVLGVKVNTPGNGYTSASVVFGNDSTGSPSATGRVYLNVSSNAAPFAWTPTVPNMNATTATNQVVLVENPTLSTSGANNLIPGGVDIELRKR